MHARLGWHCGIVFAIGCSAAQVSRPAPQTPHTQETAGAAATSAPQAGLSVARHTPRISAVALRIADAPRALAFYEGLLGMVERGRRDAGNGEVEIALAFPQSGGAELRLLDAPGSEAPHPDRAYSRFGLRVADIEGLVNKLAAGGATILRRPSRVESLKLSYALVRDPDNALIELLQYDPPAEPGHDAEGSALPRIGFVSFTLGDAPASLGFYERIFGVHESGRFEVNPDTTEVFATFPQAPPSDASFVLVVHKTAAGALEHGNVFDRLCVRVDDLAALKGRLQSERVTIESTRDASGADGTALRFRDPDGYLVEVAQDN